MKNGCGNLSSFQTQPVPRNNIGRGSFVFMKETKTPLHDAKSNRKKNCTRLQISTVKLWVKTKKKKTRSKLCCFLQIIYGNGNYVYSPTSIWKVKDGCVPQVTYASFYLI